MSTKSRYAIVWRVAIIILIAVFSIAGLTSCGGAATEPTSFSTSGGEYTGTGGGQTTTPNNNPNNNYTLPNDNPSDYYKIRVPFGVGGDGYTNVSYKDTNKLKQLWLDQINRKAENDGKVFAIRNRGNNADPNNFQKTRTHGQFKALDYYYFNENGDIVYKEDNTIIKKFVGAIITEYRDVHTQRGHVAKLGNNDNRRAIISITWKKKGIYTVGAIYANTLTTEEAKKKYHWDSTGNNPFKDGVYDFITYRHQVETFHNGVSFRNDWFERQYINPGFIEVLVMYDYSNDDFSGAASVHSYYAYYGERHNHNGFTPENMLYMTNQNVYLGQRPIYTTKQLNHTAVFTDSFRDWCYLFMPGSKN